MRNSTLIRRWLLATPATLLVLVVLDLLVWGRLTHQLEIAFGQWAAQCRSQGWAISTGTPRRGGWPFAATLTLPDTSLAGGVDTLPGGFSWQAEKVSLSLRLLHLFSLAVEPEGRQVLRVSRVPPLVFAADQIEAAVPFGEGRPDSFDLQARDVTAGVVGSGHPQDVRIASIAFHIRLVRLPADHTQTTFKLDTSSIGLPDSGRWALGATVSALSLSATLVSPPLPDLNPALQAAAWRQGDGFVVVDAMRLRWGPLLLNAQARLGLDAGLQPEGAGAADIAGYAPALDALAGGGALPQGVAMTAKTVLRLMSASPDGTVHLPFALGHSTLTVGGIPLSRLGKVVWGAR